MRSEGVAHDFARIKVADIHGKTFYSANHGLSKGKKIAPEWLLALTRGGKKGKNLHVCTHQKKNLPVLASEVENPRFNMSVISATYLLYGSQIVAHYYLATTLVIA